MSKTTVGMKPHVSPYLISKKVDAGNCPIEEASEFIRLKYTTLKNGCE